MEGHIQCSLYIFLRGQKKRMVEQMKIWKTTVLPDYREPGMGFRWGMDNLIPPGLLVTAKGHCVHDHVSVAISDVTNLQGDTFYFGTQLWRFWPVVSWHCGFWVYGSTVWLSLTVEQNFSPLVWRAKKAKRALRFCGPLQGPNDLPLDPPLKNFTRQPKPLSQRLW
jgi:hypothetical protein